MSRSNLKTISRVESPYKQDCIDTLKGIIERVERDEVRSVSVMFQNNDGSTGWVFSGTDDVPAQAFSMMQLAIRRMGFQLKGE